MIKAIIFDLGGVVLIHTSEVTTDTLAEVFDVNKKDLKIVFKKYENDWVTGKITATFLANQLKLMFRSKKSMHKILKYWKEIYQINTSPNKELIKIIDVLKTRYKIFLLTNTTDIHHNLNANRRIFNHFDEIFTSFEIGKRKPDLDFYEHALKEVNLKATECIFTDDLKENIDAAIKLGFKAVLFQNNKTFIRELNKIGIKI